MTVDDGTTSTSYGAMAMAPSLPSRGDIHDHHHGLVRRWWRIRHRDIHSISTLALDTTLIEDGDGLGTLSYQWYADGTAIDGATSSTYTPDANDLDLIGNTYTVEISQTDGEGTDESMMSSSSTPSPSTQRGTWTATVSRTTSTRTSTATARTTTTTRSSSTSTPGTTPTVTGWPTSSTAASRP